MDYSREGSGSKPSSLRGAPVSTMLTLIQNPRQGKSDSNSLYHKSQLRSNVEKKETFKEAPEKEK